MDTLHNWVLWRFVVIGLITLPFLVAVVVEGLRQWRTGAPNSTSESNDASASPAIAGPGAWPVASDANVEIRSVDKAPIVEKRAA